MRIYDYLNTPQGQYNRHNWQKIYNHQYFSMQHEIKSKKSAKPHQILALQNSILESMQERRKRAFRGKIAVDLLLTPTSNNPPHIHNAVKFLLDVFARPHPDLNTKRKGLIYYDDSQIAYLSVKYNLSNVTSGSRILCSFQPFRNFLQDIHLAYEILSGRYDDARPYVMREEESEDYFIYNEKAQLAKLLEQKEEFVRQHGMKLFEYLVKVCRRNIQNSLLENSKLSITDVYFILHGAGIIPLNEELKNGQLIALEEQVQKLSRQTGDWIVNSPIRIKLPRVPIKMGETKKFKRKIKTSLAEYRKANPILKQLYFPVGLDVLYKAPLTSSSFVKDLDNIMKMVLPVFHEEFKPPPTFLSSLDLDEIKDENYRRKMELELKKQPKSVKHSVTGYEILEIPRHSKDTSEGYINIGITGGRYLWRSSLWRRIDDVIEDLENFRL